MVDHASDNQLDDAIIGRLHDADELTHPAALANLGFTAALLPPGARIRDTADATGGSPLLLLSSDTVPPTACAGPLSERLQQVASASQWSARDLWDAHERTREEQRFTEVLLPVHPPSPAAGIALMIQCALPHIPIVHLGVAAHDLPRDVAEYLRSLFFWRRRFGVSSLRPRVVHAADDGTLILVLGSWLVAINGNPSEISIDVGSGGAMWLMLATHRHVQMHGHLLVLPPWSGAIMANEVGR